MINESDLNNLAYNENRVYLGHYGGNGTIVNGVDVPGQLPGLRHMETWARDYGGKLLNDLPYSMDVMRPLSRLPERSFSTLAVVESVQDH